MTELTPELADKLERLREAKTRIAEWQAVADELAAEFRATGVDDYTLDGQTVVTVTETRRFDPQYAKSILPTEVAEACSEWQITSAKARKILPPEAYALCQQPSGKPTVRLV